MAEKKRGLGRGLEALLGQAAARPAAGAPTKPAGIDELAHVPVDLLQRGKYQPRLDMREESLAELADSIRAQGVVQPIVVRPLAAPEPGASQRYEIVAGERRWRAVQLAGLPDQWFSAPALVVGDPLYRPGFSDADAALDIGDSALVECCGLGGAASAASPSVAAFLGGGMADAAERTYRMERICLAESERFRMPTLDGLGTPLGVDARACVELGETPLINTGILHKNDGGQIGAGVAQAPLAPFREAVLALAQ